jgi:hypothetical protein
LRPYGPPPVAIARHTVPHSQRHHRGVDEGLSSPAPSRRRRARATGAEGPRTAAIAGAPTRSARDTPRTFYRVVDRPVACTWVGCAPRRAAVRRNGGSAGLTTSRRHAGSRLPARTGARTPPEWATLTGRVGDICLDMSPTSRKDRQPPLREPRPRRTEPRQKNDCGSAASSGKLVDMRTPPSTQPPLVLLFDGT